MADPEKTNPPFAERVKDATAKADPYFDRVLESAKESQWTPWLVVAGGVLCIIFWVILSR